MNTAMQAEIRSAETEHFPQKQRFIEYSESGSLLEPEYVAQKLFNLITVNQSPVQIRYSVNDL